MATKFGFESFNKQLNTTNQGNVFNTLATLAQTITAVRVKSIILSETHPRFKELGEWNGLGTIEFQPVDNPQESVSYSTAIPLFPNTKTYPLIN
jgi:hypothetical protein